MVFSQNKNFSTAPAGRSGGLEATFNY